MGFRGRGFVSLRVLGYHSSNDFVYMRLDMPLYLIARSYYELHLCTLYL